MMITRLKPLHALDRRVWKIKVATIIESPNHETLIVDELFSKLKSTKIDLQSRAKIENPLAPTMALVPGSGRSSSNSSPTMFALSSLMSISEEQVEVLGDNDLALVINRFKWFHDDHKNCWCGGQKEGCYNYGASDHFIANCPKPKSKHKYDSIKHKYDSSNSNFEVPLSANELATELEMMNDDLLSQDKFLR
jgi:hypothetical protein